MHTLQNISEDERPAALALGSHTLDDHALPYIIAEAGVNHDGQLDQARRLIDAARMAGASAVKFQVFQAARLVSYDAPSAKYQMDAGCSDSQRELLTKLELHRDDFLTIRDYCRQAGIDFLATPFGVEDLQLVMELEPPAIKIASTDLNNTPLLEAVINTGRPVLLSTGASLLSEIDEAVRLFDQEEACGRLVLLHCVSSYPTAPHEANLSTIRWLQQRYNVWPGFSDHTQSVDSGALAVACGARVLEKHLTLDHALTGPDHAFSLEPAEFTQYVTRSRMAQVMIGQPRRSVAAAEQEVRQLARKSIVTQITIRQGEKITEQHLALKRPGGGLEPSAWNRLIGRVARFDIPAETRLDWSMVS
ncbi:MAG: N,N'-diacetyllegionaminic acid synthase [Phycisphaerae bacterium]|nr:N,N'-diacetyllegionaminic acid synthase [Phycisphaerae bacterium]